MTPVFRPRFFPAQDRRDLPFSLWPLDTDQYLRPVADLTVGSWLNELGGTPLYTSIDEVSANDADYITSENNPSTSIARTTLEAGNDPLTSTGHIVLYRYRKTGSGFVELTVSLRQNTTVIANGTTHSPTTSWADGSFTLTAGQANSITDYSDLNLQFVANKVAGGVVTAQVSWAVFQIPYGAPVAAATSRNLLLLGVGT